jgi:hypothetical protein
MGTGSRRRSESCGVTAQQIEGAFVGMASLTAGVLVLARLPHGDAIAARFGRYRNVFGVVARHVVRALVKPALTASGELLSLLGFEDTMMTLHLQHDRRAMREYCVLQVFPGRP